MRRWFLTHDEQERWKDRITAWIFPSFSERELIMLSFLGFLAAVEYRSLLGHEFVLLIRDIVAFDDPGEDVKLVFALLLLGIIFTAMIINLIHHALHERYMDDGEKKLFSFFFYAALSFVTFISIIESTRFTPTTIWGKINEINLLLLGAVSFIRLVSVLILVKADKESVFARQMTDDQCGRNELIFILVSGLITYVTFRGSHSLPTTISLAYFYVSLALFFLRDFSERFLLRG